MFCCHLNRTTHTPLPNSVAEVISHVPGRAAQRGWVPWFLRPPVAKQMAGFVCLEGIQAKVKEPELRDQELLLCCARGTSGSDPISSAPGEDLASDPHRNR